MKQTLSLSIDLDLDLDRAFWPQLDKMSMQWIYLSVLFFKFIYDLFGHLGLVVLSVDINKVSG